jgi:hypothetical protein
MPPPLQIGRPIGFVGTHTAAVNLTIRPEELTRFEPSRLAVQQTLGGAWIDGFDRGIITIKISGHTGWRGGGPGTAIGGGGGLSGEAQFHDLRVNSFTAWHQARADIISGGGDPSVVQLTFVDTLNGFTDLVAPKSFTLRRSKTRPLLMMYSIEMLVLQDAATPTVAGAPGGFATNFGYLFQAANLTLAAATLAATINTAAGAAGL